MTKRERRFLWPLICEVALLVPLTADAALPSNWRYEQRFTVAAPGLVKLSLPPETLNGALAGLEDLRIHDDAGNEVPFLIERPRPKGKAVQIARSFQVSLNSNATVITIETGLTQPVGGIMVETPAASFIKGVKVEGSPNGQAWQNLADDQPIFRQANGPGHLHVAFSVGAWRWLRLTVDDRRSPPIPFTGARVVAENLEPVPSVNQSSVITERDENPGETRLTVNLGAANLTIAAIHIETAAPLFARTVSVASLGVSEDSVREQAIGQGPIYRVAVEGQPASANLTVPIESQVRSREILVSIRNDNSPPLAVTGVRVDRRPVYVVFMAGRVGTYHLLLGNSRAVAPHYDLTQLGANLRAATVSAMKLSDLLPNPDFRQGDALPELDVSGAPLDVSLWKYRKSTRLEGDGAQQLELDLDVLSHASPGLGDLRLVRGDIQTPYIIQRTSIDRELVPSLTVSDDPKKTKRSRWLVKLPRAGLPIKRLVLTANTPLFEREIHVSEELTDERGEKYRRALGHALWLQTPDRKSRELVVTFVGGLRSDTVFVETENGDNPTIQLDRIAATYSVVRVLFKAKREEGLFLYYGNAAVEPPRYDLSLAAAELLRAERVNATLGDEEQLRENGWLETQTPGKGGVLLWGVLALVVVVLLLMMSRLLPKRAGAG